MLSGPSVETDQGNELTRNSSGNGSPRSSLLAEPLWTDPCLKSGIGVCELISTLKKKDRRKRRQGQSSKLPPPPPESS